MSTYDSLEIDLQAYHNDCGKVDTAISSLSAMISTSDHVAENRESMSASMYQLVQQSVESFSQIAGIGIDTNRYLPSNESHQRRYDLGDVTMEGLGEGIKNVYMSIINAIRAAFNWMKGLVKRLFGRNKDRTEKLEKLKDQSGAVKGEWLESVQLENPEIIRKICTPRGIMTHEDIGKLTTELNEIFSKQSANMTKVAASVKDKEVKFNWEPPLPKCTDSNLIKQVSRNPDESVCASHEFGNSEYVYIVIPNPTGEIDGDDRANVKAKLKRVDGLRIGKANSGKPVDVKQHSLLKGDLANGDKLIETVMEFNKVLMAKVSDLEHFMSSKEKFINDFESTIKKEGVHLFSSAEKKNTRDTLMFRLKMFKKTMDEPATTYYGMCDGIVTAFAQLATTVLAMNRSPEQHKKPEGGNDGNDQ